MTEPRRINVLVAALGGEGGGVLTDWLVQAALAADLPVQSTSIPGVAQRTGATTYYLELCAETGAALAGRRPVFGLYPGPGDVDVVVASELVEAGRAIKSGFVTPERTTLIAATHRVYAIEEKAAMADGRFEAERVQRAAREMARHAVLFDPSGDPKTRGLPLNAVLLGALAGSGELPIALERFREAIRASGIAVEANLQAFERGLALAHIEPPAPEPRSETAPGTLAEAARDFPPDCARTIELGFARLVDYQDEEYARRYLDRLRRVLALEPRGTGRLTEEVARQLALWMSYEDVIRVADLKTRRERFAKVREETGAGPHEPVRITEFLKPGVEEVAALLPERLGRRLQAFAGRRGQIGRLHLPLHLRSTSLFGFAQLWLLARLRRFRPRSYRFVQEQARIEAWIETIERPADDYELAVEIARLPSLLKGYGDTHRRGLRNYEAIISRVVAPAMGVPGAARLVHEAREAALADPEGDGLERALVGIEERLAEMRKSGPSSAAEPVGGDNMATAGSRERGA